MEQPLFDILPPSAVKEQLKCLWHEAFGDSSEFIEAFFGNFPCDECAHTLSVGGRVVSVLYALPCTLCVGGKEYAAAYIYAVATAADCRGRGYMQLLMERVENLLRSRGVEFLYLQPADEGLRNYYLRLGYSNCSARGVTLLPCPQVESTALHFKEVVFSRELCDFCAVVQRAAEPSVIHSPSFIAMNCFNCSAQGGGVFAVYGAGCIKAVAFVAVDGDGPLLLASFYASSLSFSFLLQSLCTRFGVAAIRLLEQGKGEPCCMSRIIGSGDFARKISLKEVNIPLLLDK